MNASIANYNVKQFSAHPSRGLSFSSSSFAFEVLGTISPPPRITQSRYQSFDIHLNLDDPCHWQQDCQGTPVGNVTLSLPPRTIPLASPSLKYLHHAGSLNQSASSSSFKNRCRSIRHLCHGVQAPLRPTCSIAKTALNQYVVTTSHRPTLSTFTSPFDGYFTTPLLQFRLMTGIMPHVLFSGAQPKCAAFPASSHSLLTHLSSSHKLLIHMASVANHACTWHHPTIHKYTRRPAAHLWFIGYRIAPINFWHLFYTYVYVFPDFDSTISSLTTYLRSLTGTCTTQHRLISDWGVSFDSPCNGFVHTQLLLRRHWVFGAALFICIITSCLVSLSVTSKLTLTLFMYFFELKIPSTAGRYTKPHASEQKNYYFVSNRNSINIVRTWRVGRLHSSYLYHFKQCFSYQGLLA